jgi:hypothetical protein
MLSSKSLTFIKANGNLVGDFYLVQEGCDIFSLFLLDLDEKVIYHS